jgi:limonene-1,2-epoxide hydrolase
VRSAVLVGIVLLAALAGCGGAGTSPRSVVFAWSDALRANDNGRAARLFAKDAVVIQGSLARTFHTRAQAVDWNARLPCSGKVVSVQQRGSTATATFRLGNRKGSPPCGDPPGAEVVVVFVVEDGKIILWDQIGSQIVSH